LKAWWSKGATKSKENAKEEEEEENIIRRVLKKGVSLKR